MEKTLRRQQETGNMERRGRKITNMFEDIQKDIDAARAAGKLPPLNAGTQEGESRGAAQTADGQSWKKTGGQNQNGAARTSKWGTGAASGGWNDASGGGLVSGSNAGGNSGGNAIGGVQLPQQTGGQKRESALPRWGTGASVGSGSTGAGEWKLSGGAGQNAAPFRKRTPQRLSEDAEPLTQRPTEQGAWRDPFGVEPRRRARPQRTPERKITNMFEDIQKDIDAARAAGLLPPLERKRDFSVDVGSGAAIDPGFSIDVGSDAAIDPGFSIDVGNGAEIDPGFFVRSAHSAENAEENGDVTARGGGFSGGTGGGFSKGKGIAKGGFAGAKRDPYAKSEEEQAVDDYDAYGGGELFLNKKLQSDEIALRAASEAYQADPTEENWAALEEAYDQAGTDLAAYDENAYLYTERGAQEAADRARDQITDLRRQKRALWADYPEQEMSRLMLAAGGGDVQRVLRQMEARGEDIGFYQRAMEIQAASALLDRQIEAAERTWNTAQDILLETGGSMAAEDALAYDTKQPADTTEAKYRKNQSEEAQNFGKQAEIYLEMQYLPEFQQYAGCTPEDVKDILNENDRALEMINTQMRAPGDLDPERWADQPQYDWSAMEREAQEEQEYLLLFNDLMPYVTQDELDTWNYLRETQGREAAHDYFDFMHQVWNERWGRAIGKEIREDPNLLARDVQSYLYSLRDAADAFGFGLNQAAAEEELPWRVSHYGSEYIRNDLNPAQRWLYDTLPEAADAAIGMIVETLNPFSAIILTLAEDLSDAGVAYKEALEGGADPNKLKQYQRDIFMVNSVIDLFSALGGKQITEWVDKALPDGAKKVLTDLGINIGLGITTDGVQDVGQMLQGMDTLPAISDMRVYDLTRERVREEQAPSAAQKIRNTPAPRR